MTLGRTIEESISAVDDKIIETEGEFSKLIAMLTKAKEEPVDACGKNVSSSSPTWRRISIAVDSGACDSVIAPDEVPEQEVHGIPESKQGESFYSATSESVPNLGEIELPTLTRGGTACAMRFHAAQVAKPLGSVKKICEAGHFV